MRLLQAKPRAASGSRNRPCGRQAPGQPIRVQTRDGVPARVLWRGQTFRVENVEAVWCIEGRWWLDAKRQGARRRCFRLMLSAPGVAPICVEVLRQGEAWKVRSIAD